MLSRGVTKQGCYLESISIRPFQEDDVDFAHDLDLKEGWNDTKYDIRRMFDYEPDGCFIAEVNGQPAGQVFTVNYERFGWIGLLIVKPVFRERGIGTMLMEQAIDYLLQCGVKTVRLEAVPRIAVLYRRLGFRDEYDSLRFAGEDVKVESLPSHQVHSMKTEEIVELSKFDARYFGANRLRVLQELYRSNPQGCFVYTSGSEITGYIMSRNKEEGHVLGPWVCSPENPDTGRGLLAEYLKRIGGHKIYVGVPAVNQTATKTLKSFGFRQYSKSIRMYLGERPDIEEAEGLFAIGGPEKG